MIREAKKSPVLFLFPSHEKNISFFSARIDAEIGIFFSCKKEILRQGCKEGNKPPIFMAGPDQVITLPTDSVSLDGSSSGDPDGKISSYLWTKFSGPASFNIRGNKKNLLIFVRFVYPSLIISVEKIPHTDFIVWSREK